MHAMLIDFSFFAYTTQLANALSEMCQVSLMLPDRAPHHCEAMIKEQVAVHRFHMPRLRYPSNLLMVRGLFQAIDRLKPDVVHLLAWNPWLNLALPVFPRVPLVATIHDASRHPGERPIPLHSWQWRRAERVIVHGQAIKRQMIEQHHVAEERIDVVPHGAFSLYRTWLNPELQENGHLVLFFGRIWAYKGLQHLIEAEPSITAQVPEARIVIAGEGEPFDKYEQMMVNRDHFIVHNYRIPDEMVTRIFQEASVVVLPYIEASQSGVLALAYALGKPVVSTTVGGIPEVVDDGETGILVPPGDTERLAEAIVTLLKDRALREKMGRKALEKADRELGWESIAHKTLRVYERAVG
jgi:starch synthase